MSGEIKGADRNLEFRGEDRTENKIWRASRKLSLTDGI